MWSNAPLVLLSVRLGERFRLRLPLGLWAVSGLLLSLDLSLIHISEPTRH